MASGLYAAPKRFASSPWTPAQPSLSCFAPSCSCRGAWEGDEVPKLSAWQRKEPALLWVGGACGWGQVLGAQKQGPGWLCCKVACMAERDRGASLPILCEQWEQCWAVGHTVMCGLQLLRSWTAPICLVRHGSSSISALRHRRLSYLAVDIKQLFTCNLGCSSRMFMHQKFTCLMAWLGEVPAGSQNDFIVCQ